MRAIVFIVSLLLGSSAFAQRISNLRIDTITQRSITVRFDTDVPCVSKVFYMPVFAAASNSDSLDTQTPLSQSFATSHVVRLQNLDPATFYQVRVVAYTPSGSGSSQPYPQPNIQTLAQDQSLAHDYEVKVTGGTRVFAGSNLITLPKVVWLSGPWTQPHNVSISRLTIPGATAVFQGTSKATTVFYSAASDTLTIAVPLTTPPGQYQMDISVSGQGITRTTTKNIRVDSAPQPIVRQAIGTVPPIPNYAKWQSNMKTFADRWCSRYPDEGGNNGGIMWDYDAQAVFLQIGDYLKDPKYARCAIHARKHYRDNYVLPNNGGVTGFYAYAEGLYQDVVRNGDVLSRDALDKMMKRSAATSIIRYYGTNDDAIREVSFGLEVLLRARDLGLTVDPTQIPKAVDLLLSHFDQLFVTKNSGYIKPFMVGLGLNALARYYDSSNDPRVPVVMKEALDGLWAASWLGDKPGATALDQGFYYTSGAEPHKAVVGVLSNMIAPMYWYFYSISGDPRYQQLGDRIFNASVGDENAGNIGWAQKQFSEVYNYTLRHYQRRLISGDLVAPAAPSGFR